MKEGSKIRLKKDYRAIRKGCSGIVELHHRTDEISVSLTHTPEGELFRWLLPPLPETYFEPLAPANNLIAKGNTQNRSKQLKVKR